MDAQQVEIVGQNTLTTSLVRGGIEVAEPRRDRGIDLIAYRDGQDRFDAVPIQLKAHSRAGISIDRKYERFAGLAVVFVWGCAQPPHRIFTLTYLQLHDLATTLGWTDTTSWTSHNKYSTSQPSKECQGLLERYEVRDDNWDVLLRTSVSARSFS